MKREVGVQTPIGTILSEEHVLDNPFFRVIERVIVTPNGEKREPQLLWDQRGKEFAIVVARTPNDRLVFVREPKFGQMDHFLVLPTGSLRDNEGAMAAAEREFGEETGYTAEQWRMVTLKPLIGEPDKREGGEHHVATAKNAIKVRLPERGREVVLLSLKETLGEVRLGNIRVDMTLAGLLLAIINHPENES